MKPSAYRIIAPAQIAGTVELPASKSEANRMLVLELLRPQGGVSGLPDSDDVQVLVDLAKQLGLIVGSDERGTSVTGGFPTKKAPDLVVHTKLAGSASRFLAAALCFYPGTVVLDGDTGLRGRPIKPLLDSLRQAGAEIEGDALPLRIRGSATWRPTRFVLDASASSQFLSALMLLAPRLLPFTRIEMEGIPPSEPYVLLTQQILSLRGYHWVASGNAYTLHIHGIDAHLQPAADWTAASYLLGMALLRPSRLTLIGLYANSAQGDRHQLACFHALGLKQTWVDGHLTVEGTGKPSAANLDLNLVASPDLAQTFAVLALALAEPSTLLGLHTLPHKETNRLVALQTELEKAGATVRIGPNWLTLTPPKQLVGEPYFHSYGDHRMAMSFALAACLFPSIVIEDPEVVTKSFPTYWEVLKGVGFEVANQP
jgi:3-phosphoshikimate 1-carboxyvinyltransferase